MKNIGGTTMNNNPAIPFLLIILLGIGLVFLLSAYGADQMNNESDTADSSESTEESDDSGDDGEETASTSDFDPETFARDNCASCHGQDFTGGMGPDIHGIDPESFMSTVREGQGPMPAFSTDQISDEDLEVLAAHFE